MRDAKRIIIFDTTLRDGEQAPGCSMTVDEKIMVAQQLERLGVDVIEAGFPIASPGDFASVRDICKIVRGPVIAGLARCMNVDIDRAGEAIKGAAKGRIHVFLATSKIHRDHKLKMSRQEVLKRAVEGVKRALTYTADVEFSAEDAARTEPDFLREVVEAVIDAGATTVNVPDSVGYAVPAQYGEMVAMLMAEVSNVDRAVISVHCHNDLGMAVANSLTAVRAGARQVECTINGLGERAGNCALEEVVMALKTRADFFGVETGVHTQQIMNSSRLVSSVTGIHVPPNKAVVGGNAFAHEAGIHQDGVLKEKTTYEIMRPEDIGLDRSTMVLGKHSGSHAFGTRLEELGIHVNSERLDRAFRQFKVLADKKKDIYDEDIEALVRDEVEAVPETYKLVSFEVLSCLGHTPTATVTLQAHGKDLQTAYSTGDGPIDAICRAVDRITGISCQLQDYAIRAITVGKDAMGEVTLEIRSNGRRERARAAKTDIIEASAVAYVSAVNRLYQWISAGKPEGEKPHGM